MTWRERVLQEHAPELGTWWGQVKDESIPSDDEFESADRANYLEAVRHYDQQAQYAEELHVRLAGAAARGALDFDLGRRLFKPLQDGISASAGTDVRMELVGVLPGSTVLVARPEQPSDFDDEAMATADTSPADKGAREWLHMLSTAEVEGDLRRWTSAFGPLGQLVKVLDECELDVGMMWLAHSGQQRQAKLTQRGRTYVRRLREAATASTERLVGGRVTELRESGHVKLRGGTQRGAPTYDVRFSTPDDLLDLHLELGSSVWFLVREDVTSDQIGNILDTRHTYLRTAAQDEPIPG